MSCAPSAQQLAKIASIVREVEKLSDTEKLLLYLQLPHGRATSTTSGQETSSGRHKSIAATVAAAAAGQPARQASASEPDQLVVCAPKKPDNETTLTYTWILSHLEEDPGISLPKQEVYDEYRAFCQANRFEPLCVADFGKAMKHALPCIKPRRLGQRGNSRYCYSGLRKKYRIEPPACADLTDLTPSSKRADQPPAASNKPPGGGPGAQHKPRPGVGASGVLRNMQGPGDVGGSGASYECRPAASSSGQMARAQQAGFRGGSGSGNSPGIKSKSESCADEACEQPQVATPTSTCCLQTPAPSTCAVIQSTSGPYLERGGPSGARQSCAIDYTPGHPMNQHPRPQQHPSQHHHHHQQQYGSRQHLQHPNLAHPHPLPHPGGQAVPPPPPPPLPSGYLQTYLPRPGTPDDDDYRHNYHDLNRPIIGPAIIPFQQSMSVQMAKQPAPHESFISYSNTSYASPLAGPQQQQQQPVAPTQQAPTSQIQQQQQQPRMHQMAPIPSCCANGTLATSTLTSTAAPADPSNSSAHEHHHHHQQAQQQQQQQQTQQHQQHAFEGSPASSVRNHTLAHLNLSLNAEGAEMDFTSPFQSPASTPYSSMLTTGASYLTPEAQDYYSTATPSGASAADCNIPYPDLQ